MIHIGEHETLRDGRIVLPYNDGDMCSEIWISSDASPYVCSWSDQLAFEMQQEATLGEIAQKLQDWRVVAFDVEPGTWMYEYFEYHLRRFFMKKPTNWELKVINPEPDHLRLDFKLEGYEGSCGEISEGSWEILRREAEDFVAYKNADGQNPKSDEELVQEVLTEMHHYFYQSGGDVEVHLCLDDDPDNPFTLNVMQPSVDDPAVMNYYNISCHGGKNRFDLGQCCIVEHRCSNTTSRQKLQLNWFNDWASMSDDVVLTVENFS